MLPRTGCKAVALASGAARIQLFWGVALTFAAGFGPLVVAWCTKLLVDEVAAQQIRWHTLLWTVAALAAAGVVTAAVPHAARYVDGELDRRVKLRATTDLYAAVDRFTGLRPFEDPVFLDRIQVARSSGVAGPAMAVDGVLGAGRSTITIAGFAGTLFVLGPWIAVALLVSAVPALLAELSLGRQRARMIAQTGQAERREMFYASRLTDPQVAQELRLFGAGVFLRRRMRAEIQLVQDAHRRVDRRQFHTQTGLAVLGAATAGGLLLWAIHGAARGTLSVGDVVLVLAAVASVQSAVSGLVTDISTVHQALLLFDPYLQVVEAEPDLPTRAASRPASRLRHGLEFRDVWFRYAADQPWVLRELNLTLAAGTSTGLVGLNGAGKSTLVKLLCRLYDPDRGAILWDGVDLRDLDPALLRNRIRAVFQDAPFYDLTARENIALGDLSALTDPSRVETAARLAGIHDVVAALPGGYDQLLTRIFFSEADRADPATGVVLSGGQRQRLALARALVRDRPDLLVLDEPATALDAQAEHALNERLRVHRRGLTSLLISHRLSAVREADLVVVLADGKVTESGRHTELMAAGGPYAQMFTLQAEGYQSSLPEEVA